MPKFYTVATALLFSEPLWYLSFFSPRAEPLRTCFLLFLHSAKRALSSTFCFPVFKLLPVQKKKEPLLQPPLTFPLVRKLCFIFFLYFSTYSTWASYTIYFRGLWTLTDFLFLDYSFSLCFLLASFFCSILPFVVYVWGTHSFKKLMGKVDPCWRSGWIRTSQGLEATHRNRADFVTIGILFIVFGSTES